MNMRVLRRSATATLVFAVLRLMVSAQETGDAEHPRTPAIDGVWVVNVTVRDCQTGNLIRSLHALNLYIHDGSLTETAVNAEPAVNVPRTPSVGTWRHLGGRTYASTLNFFRYETDGTFASRARVTRTIELNEDGSVFTSTGTVKDFDANNVLISTGCSTETGTRPE